MPPFPSLTKEWHDKPYPSIDPTRPELSARGKTVVITGGGGSIGGATALAFAKAGATQIAVVGRKKETLEKTKASVEGEVPGAKVLVSPGDITDEKSIKDALAKAASEFGGKIDILVANAGYLPAFEGVNDAEPDEWWNGFEINVKGTFNQARAFVPVASKGALVLAVSTCVVHMPAMAKASGYVSSKLAGTKVWETVDAENENLSVIHIHPGVVESEINLKSGISALDSAHLPGCFMVWAASPEADFLRGKYLWVNWNVDELKERKEELRQPDQLTITMNGWPFGQNSDKDTLKF